MAADDIYRPGAPESHVSTMPSYVDSHLPHDAIWRGHKVQQLQEKLYRGEIRSFIAYEAALAKSEIFDTEEAKLNIEKADRLRKSAIWWLIQDHEAASGEKITLELEKSVAIYTALEAMNRDRQNFWTHARTVAGLLFPALPPQEAMNKLAAAAFTYNEINGVIEGFQYKSEEIGEKLGPHIPEMLQQIKAFKERPQPS